MSTPAVTLAPEAVKALAEALAKPTVERLAYSPHECAEALGVSRTYFDEQIKPELRVIRRGKRILIPKAELDRWVAESAERVFE